MARFYCRIRRLPTSSVLTDLAPALKKFNPLGVTTPTGRQFTCVALPASVFATHRRNERRPDRARTPLRRGEAISPSARRPMSGAPDAPTPRRPTRNVVHGRIPHGHPNQPSPARPSCSRNSPSPGGAPTAAIHPPNAGWSTSPTARLASSRPASRPTRPTPCEPSTTSSTRDSTRRSCRGSWPGKKTTCRCSLLEDLGAAHWPPPWTRDQLDAVLHTLDLIHALRAAGSARRRNLGEMDRTPVTGEASHRTRPHFLSSRLVLANPGCKTLCRRSLSKSNAAKNAGPAPNLFISSSTYEATTSAWLGDRVCCSSIGTGPHEATASSTRELAADLQGRRWAGAGRGPAGSLALGRL